MKKMYKIKNISDKEINFFHAKFLKEGCVRSWGREPRHIYYVVDVLPAPNSYDGGWDVGNEHFRLIGKTIRRCFIAMDKRTYIPIIFGRC